MSPSTKNPAPLPVVVMVADRVVDLGCAAGIVAICLAGKLDGIPAALSLCAIAGAQLAERFAGRRLPGSGALASVLVLFVSEGIK